MDARKFRQFGMILAAMTVFREWLNEHPGANNREAQQGVLMEAAATARVLGLSKADAIAAVESQYATSELDPPVGASVH